MEATDSSSPPATRLTRSRWAAIGAALAVAVGASGLMTASAQVSFGERNSYVPITPCRVMDTRSGADNVGGRAHPLGPRETHTIRVPGGTGQCSIPAIPTAVVMNVTVISPTATSFLTIYPADVARPLASSINWLASDTIVGNSVTADLSADHRVSFYNLAGTVDVAVDVVGYYAHHDHNDLYYTKSEVDAKTAPQATAWGRVLHDGLIAFWERSANVTNSFREAVGRYCIVFEGAIQPSRLASAVISGAGSGPLMAENTTYPELSSGVKSSCPALAPGYSGLSVRLYDHNGQLTDGQFSFIVP